MSATIFHSKHLQKDEQVQKSVLVDSFIQIVFLFYMFTIQFYNVIKLKSKCLSLKQLT